jgi:hypothetical protein
MRYKTIHSESEDYVIYRRFNHTSRQRGIRGFLATLFASLAIFTLLPLPDEFIIIPALSKLVTSIQPMDFHTAAIYSYGIYKGLGILFLAIALLFGVEYLRDSFRSKVKHMKKAHKDLHKHARAAHAKTKATVKKHLSIFF